jgi:hypothetical protein
MRATLKREQAALASNYSITGIALLVGSQLPKIVVCFRQSPDLATFFALKQSLANLCHLEIELLPDFALSSSQLQNNVEWIWRDGSP